MCTFSSRKQLLYNLLFFTLFIYFILCHLSIMAIIIFIPCWPPSSRTLTSPGGIIVATDWFIKFSFLLSVPFPSSVHPTVYLQPHKPPFGFWAKSVHDTVAFLPRLGVKQWNSVTKRLHIGRQMSMLNVSHCFYVCLCRLPLVSPITVIHILVPLLV